jgi:hypothetical protein
MSRPEISSKSLRKKPENLFLRKQLALFQERKIQPRRAVDSRWMMVTLSRMFPWRDALVNVKANARPTKPDFAVVTTTTVPIGDCIQSSYLAP